MNSASRRVPFIAGGSRRFSGIGAAGLRSISIGAPTAEMADCFPPLSPPNNTDEIANFLKTKNVLLSRIVQWNKDHKLSCEFVHTTPANQAPPQCIPKLENKALPSSSTPCVGPLQAGLVQIPHACQRGVRLDIADLKKGIVNALPVSNDAYEVCLALVEPHRFGYHVRADWTYKHVALVFLNYFDIAIESILKEITPTELALCCYDVYDKMQALIHPNCISKYFGPKLKKSTEILDMTPLETLFDQFKTIKTTRCKNEALTKWLDSLSNPCLQDEFLHEQVAQYCAEELHAVTEIVYTICPSITVGPPKESYRLRQKFQEYSANFMKPGIHVYRKFKDLFRGMVLAADLHEQSQRALQQYLVCGKLRKDIQVLYLILNIRGNMFELQVVLNLEKAHESHAYYELLRETSVPNLRLFIQRSLNKPPNAIRNKEASTSPPTPLSSSSEKEEVQREGNGNRKSRGDHSSEEETPAKKSKL